MEQIKIYGKRLGMKADIQSADAFLKLVLALRGRKPFLPKGVYRFKSFGESDRWLMKMMTASRNQDRRQ